ncbi:MAG: hypothetical protein KBB88_00340 [Candidatus Pacebacteria bacterium]|nr:hypothetical protein [Candidatus Paceibacterota bacterium]
MSIQLFKNNIKSVYKTPHIEPDSLFLVIVVFLVGFGCFGLGMIAEKDRYSSTPDQSIANQNQVLITSDVLLFDQRASERSEQTNMGSYFASRNGTVYYPVGCSAGNRVAEANKIYFTNLKEATLSGLKQSKSCAY